MSDKRSNPVEKKQERVGVYVCHCGSKSQGRWMWSTSPNGRRKNSNIRAWLSHVNISSCARAWAGTDREGYQGTRTHACCRCSLLTASAREDIPYRSEEAGLNPYLCELASIREQVSWVHTDKAVATEKAKAWYQARVSRVIENVPLEEIKVPINPNTLVVGGGIAGIQSALEIANAGFHVYLVEREPSIGGHMAQFDKTFPTLDCSACILTPRMVEAGTHPNITLLTWSEVVQCVGLRGQLPCDDQEEGTLREGRPVHRMWNLPGEVPEESDR